MTDRRFFLKYLAGCTAGFLATPFDRFFKPETSWGADRRLLPKDTRLEDLTNENPALLDTGNLEVQPLDRFGTMGLSDRVVDLKTWRLILTGRASRQIRLTYDRVIALPALERPVLLICPGFFVNHGLWRGVPFPELAKRTGLKKGVTHVTVSGPAGPYEKSFRFPWAEALSGKVFLAYQVNGEKLPVRHGFPLRLVAEGYYGYEWVKYVDRIRFEKIDKS